MNHLVPTPITDKNGKLTTVHRKASTTVSSKLASAAPVPPATEKVTGTPLRAVHPLSAGEVREFLAFYAPDRAWGNRTSDTKSVFRSLSGISQGLIWRVRQSGAVSDGDIEMALNLLESRVMSRWSGTPSPEKTAEECLRAYLLVAERLHRDYADLLGRIGPGSVLDLSKIVEYRDHRQGTILLAARKMTTEEEVASITAVAAYALVCMFSDDDTEHLARREYRDEEGRYIEGLMIANKALDAYVRENPEMAVEVAEFVVERGVGTSKKDAKFVMENLAWDAPAMSSGHL